MRIAHISLHGCIRMHKIAMSQTLMGHPCHVLANFIAPAHSSNGYASVHKWDIEADKDSFPTSPQLAEEIRILSPHVDIFHVHNEPNWIFRTVKENTNKPVVFDIHDWTSLRRVSDPPAFELIEEKYALENADGFVVPSKGYLDKIREESNKPSILAYSMVPQFLFPEVDGKSEGLVYAGGVKGKNVEFIYNYEYRNWAAFSQLAVNLTDREFDFYTANGGEDFCEYENEKIHMHPPKIYPDMMQSIAGHEAGIVGAPIEILDFRDSMPNKLFEYISAGVPAIIINAPEAQAFVEQNDLGVGIRDVSELPEALEKLTNHNVSLDRWGFTMESQIPKVLALYEEIRCAQSPRAIPQMVY